jgi:perosamine synthetase
MVGRCPMEIPLARPYFSSEELQEIGKVLQSGWVSKGPESALFESKVAKYVGVRQGVAVVNCTAALHLALLSLGIKEGDEVIVSDFTFPATAHAVLYCGAKPVFVDALPETYNLDPSKIEDLVSPKTKALIPVHAFGQPAQMDEIMKIAEENGLPVVEDAACSLGATFHGKQTGSIGVLGCFSFHARKGISTGEGGMVVGSDDGLLEKVRYLSVFGMKAAWEREKTDEYTVPEFHDVGYNYKLSDVLAALGVIQMTRLDQIIEAKRVLAHRYSEHLSKIDKVRAPVESKGCTHIYQSYVVTLDRSINRNRLIMELKRKGVQAQIGTYSCHVQPVYASKQKCPVSKMLMDHSLALPFYYPMTENEIDLVIDTLRASLKGIT